MSAKVPVYDVRDLDVIKQIKEAVEINTRMKADEKKLDDIKAGLKKTLAEGKHKTPEGDTVTVSISAKYSDTDVEAFQEMMKKKRMTRFVNQCLSVKVTEAQKFISLKELNTLRERDDKDTYRFTFKKG